MGPTILIVDDHPSFRSLARRLLEADGFDVIGEARDVAGALRAAEQLRPAMVLLDVHLPDGDGYLAAGTLTRAYPEMVVVLTSTHAPEDLEPALGSGAAGFVAKHELSGAELGAYLR